MQTQPQFTPEQLIVAGRRAEQQGQLPYALQFYRHLAEHFPSTVEAFEARDALARIAPHDHAGPQPVPPAANGYARPAPAVSAPAATQTLRAGEPAHPRHRPGDRGSDHSPRQSAARARPRADTAPRGHRMGRFVAAMLGTIGWLMLLASIIAGPAIFGLLSMRSPPKGLRELVTGNVMLLIGGGAGLFVFALFAIFAAQVARATFDTADLTRWLAQSLSDPGHDHH